jgi:hypothetical protein
VSASARIGHNGDAGTLRSLLTSFLAQNKLAFLGLSGFRPFLETRPRRLEPLASANIATGLCLMSRKSGALSGLRDTGKFESR